MTALPRSAATSRREMRGLQRAVGNGALARARLAALAPDPRGLPAGGAASIQRKVGFEFEVEVAADIDGKDAPEKVVHYDSTSKGTRLTIDHAGPSIMGFTKAIKQRAEKELGVGNSPTDAYHSIVEIVTAPAEVEDERGSKQALTYVRNAQNLAMQIFGHTNQLRRRVPLSSIVSTASALNVSADVERWGVPQRQSLNAGMQASLGVDLAQAPAFMTKLQTLERSAIPGGKDIAVDYGQILGDAVKAGASVAGEIRSAMLEGGQKELLAQGQGLANLQGLLTTMAMYLIGGFESIMVQTNWKNFTPLLSRVDLGTVFQTMTAVERDLFKREKPVEVPKGEGSSKGEVLDKKGEVEDDEPPENIEAIKGMLLSATKRWGPQVLLLKGPKGVKLPTCDEFIENVFSGRRDGVMDILKSEEQFTELAPESVGPTAKPKDEKSLPQPRRQGIIFETRPLQFAGLRKKDLDRARILVDELESGRYPLESWYPVAAELIELVQKVNATDTTSSSSNNNSNVK